jgi:lysophospholipase L1-like esterase
VGTKVLHVGDSFAGALGLPLSALFEQAGIKSVLKHTDASYLTDWAWNGELQKMLWKYNPDLLIITLGANELAIADPEQRIKTIKKITSLVGDRPCVWVAIPLWKGDHNGLLDVIRKHAAPCIYWDSNQLLDVEHMPRVADGIHPTSKARSDWAQVVFDWLKQHRAAHGGKPWALKL